MRQRTESALVQVMTCRLFCAKPLPEPVLAYCQLEAWEKNSVKIKSEFYHFHCRKCIIWNYRLPKWRSFCVQWVCVCVWGGKQLKSESCVLVACSASYATDEACWKTQEMNNKSATKCKLSLPMWLNRCPIIWWSNWLCFEDRVIVDFMHKSPYLQMIL